MQPPAAVVNFFKYALVSFETEAWEASNLTASEMAVFFQNM